MVKKHSLTFDILGDPGNSVAEKYGLVWEVEADLREVYTKFGIDIDRFNGEESWRVPMPARYVIDTDSVIRLADVNPDHTILPEPAETVEFLRNMTKG